MRIALAQLNYCIGDFEANLKKINHAIEKAINENADLIVFSELAICGYPPADFLEFDDFIDECEQHINSLLPISKKIAVVIGGPSKNQSQSGKKLYNTAYILQDGEISFTAHKTLLPNYDVFDETRYFEVNTEFGLAEVCGKKIALTICEDIWGSQNRYPNDPIDDLVKLSPDVIINISASPFDYNHFESRKEVTKETVLKCKAPLLYVNQVGANTDLVFDGGSFVMNSTGEVQQQLAFFTEEVQIFDLDKETSPKAKELAPSKTNLINNALELGIKDYFGKLGFKKAILGLSGGIDSAVTLVLATKVLGAENVEALLLPSQFSSDHSVDDSIELANNLGVPFETIKIQSLVDNYYNELSPYFKETAFGLAEENIQARVRGNLLMAFANKFNYILLNTSNKSERAVGYGTLYGDLAGGLSVLGDVYKTEVYELANYINSQKEIIPKNIITKPPSAELKPDQKDSDTLPDYDILDQVLFQYIECQKSKRQIIEMGFDKELVKRVLRMVNLNEWKRYQVSPVIRVSSKAFGIGRRMPIVANY